MRRLRKAHIYAGMVLAPFVLVTALTGVLILLFQRFYDLLHLHAWFRWGGVLIGIGLIFMMVSGTVLRLKEVLSQKRQRQR
jgi:uncharacterized iron-regulated membrane protein